MVTRKAKSLNNKAKTDSKAANEPKHIGLVVNDGYLAPYEDAIRGRHDHALWKLGQLTRNGKISLEDFASGYDYYGLHKLSRGWVFREWAPNATEIYLVGDFNNWQETEKYKAKRIEGTGNWERYEAWRFIQNACLLEWRVWRTYPGMVSASCAG